jgi:hypothetical protein
MEAECVRTGSTPGLAPDGHLVVIPPSGEDLAAAKAALMATAALRQLGGMLPGTHDAVNAVVEAAEETLARLGGRS